jgi:hypothetical protein
MPDITDKPTAKVLKPADLRAIAQLTEDGHYDRQQAVATIVSYIQKGRVKASMDSIRELRQWFGDLNAGIEAAYRTAHNLPAYDFDQRTAERSIETQILDANFRAIPAAGVEPMSVVSMMKEHKLKLRVMLYRERAARKQKGESK